MGYDEDTAERVRQILSGRRDVVEKKMVGGLSFMVNGTMCCGVTGTALMVRTGFDGRERVLKDPHVRPMEFAGRPLAGFVLVEPAGFPTDRALAAWVQVGIDFASTLTASKPAERKLRSTPRRKRDGATGGKPERA
jgi:hypothetical protein